MKDKLRVLVLIDVQHDFIDGSLANEEAQRVLPNLIKKVEEFDGDAIFLTKDTHDNNYLQTREGEKLPVEHCIYNSFGWSLPHDLEKIIMRKKEDGMTVNTILKPTFGSVLSVSADKDKFSYSTLVTEIMDLEKGTTEPIPMEIEMCGFCTDICVVSNALILKAFTYDFAEITVDSKCCAGVTPEKHEAALEVMRSCQINVV